MKKINILYTILIVLAITSCKDDYEPFKSNTVDISDEWWIQYFGYNDNDSVVLLYDYDEIKEYLLNVLDEEPRIKSMAISNTSANDDDSVWVEHNFWPFKSKLGFNSSTNTFVPATYSSLFNDVTVKLIEGKILKDAALSTSNRVTDSIYLKIEFSDDEGNEYIIAGYRNTGWIEDRHDQK